MVNRICGRYAIMKFEFCSLLIIITINIYMYIGKYAVKFYFYWVDSVNKYTLCVPLITTFMYFFISEFI